MSSNTNLSLLDHEDYSRDFSALLKNGACHYVSVAMPGLTFASEIICDLGFDTRHRNDFMMTINYKCEVGTLYPRANLTLLPSPSASYGGLDRNTYHEGDYPADVVVADILDAFQANSQYIKSRQVYFDFRNLCVSETHYVACLRAAIDRIPAMDAPEVFTWEPQVDNDRNA
jgi:hypothetical protein